MQIFICAQNALQIVLMIFACSFEQLNPPIPLKFCIITYFHALITNMIVKMSTNLIFMVKTIKYTLKSIPPNNFHSDAFFSK